MFSAKKSFVVLAVLGMLLFPTANVWADDILPPEWRGEYSTTSQYWEFSDWQPNPIAPDGSPLGGKPWLPSTQLTVIPGPDMEWIPEDASGRQGIWPLSGEIRVIVDNHEPPNEFKWMWVQLTWQPQDQGDVPILDEFDPLPDPQYEPQIVLEESLSDGWYGTIYEWRIYPNPVDEIFRISGNINVDQLVIDTWCIPEPGTLVLLVTAGLGLLLFAWRRRK